MKAKAIWIALAIVMFVVLPATVLASEEGRRYDADRSGYIEKVEVLAAINAYLFDDELSRDSVLQIINHYLWGEFVTFAVPEGREFNDTQQHRLSCTGSMVPTLTCMDEVSAALDFGPDDILPDSIITFTSPPCFDDDYDGISTLHRVMEVLGGPGGLPMYITEGDARGGADPCPVPYGNVVGLVIDTTYDVYPENAEMHRATQARESAYWVATDAYVEAIALKDVALSGSDDVHARYAQRYEELCGVPVESDATCYLDDAPQQELDELWAEYDAAWEVVVIRYPVNVQARCNYESQIHWVLTGKTVIFGECVGRDWVSLWNAVTAYAQRYEELCGSPPGESDAICSLETPAIQDLDDLWAEAEARYAVYVARPSERG